jgi:hypothetical protein
MTIDKQLLVTVPCPFCADGLAHQHPAAKQVALCGACGGSRRVPVSESVAREVAFLQIRTAMEAA